jgi:hypothetical protein
LARALIAMQLADCYEDGGNWKIFVVALKRAGYDHFYDGQSREGS